MEEITTLEQLKSFIENLTEEQINDEKIMLPLFSNLEILTKLVSKKAAIANKNKTNNGLTYNQNALLDAKKDISALQDCYAKLLSFTSFAQEVKQVLQEQKKQIDEIASCNATIIECNTTMLGVLQEAAENNRQKQSSGCLGVFIFLLGLSGGLLYLLIH